MEKIIVVFQVIVLIFVIKVIFKVTLGSREKMTEPLRNTCIKLSMLIILLLVLSILNLFLFGDEEFYEAITYLLDYKVPILIASFFAAIFFIATIFFR